MENYNVLIVAEFKNITEEAKKKRIFFIDATCPLVTKVHKESERHYKNGYQIINSSLM